MNSTQKTQRARTAGRVEVIPACFRKTYSVRLDMTAARYLENLQASSGKSQNQVIIDAITNYFEQQHKKKSA